MRVTITIDWDGPPRDEQERLVAFSFTCPDNFHSAEAFTAAWAAEAREIIAATPGVVLDHYVVAGGPL